MGFFSWLSAFVKKKSEKELLDDLYGHFLRLNNILGGSYGGPSDLLKQRLKSFSDKSLAVCENFRNNYPTLNLFKYREWIRRISSLSERFLEQCAQIEERGARVKYEEVLININDTAENLLKIINSYTARKSAA